MHFYYFTVYGPEIQYSLGAPSSYQDRVGTAFTVKLDGGGSASKLTDTAVGQRPPSQASQAYEYLHRTVHNMRSGFPPKVSKKMKESKQVRSCNFFVVYLVRDTSTSSYLLFSRANIKSQGKYKLQGAEIPVLTNRLRTMPCAVVSMCLPKACVGNLTPKAAVVGGGVT